MRVTPQAGQTTTINLTMNSTIDHVTITSTAPSVNVGATLPLTATPYDSGGNVVLVPPGNITWASANSSHCDRQRDKRRGDWRQ